MLSISEQLKAESVSGAAAPACKVKIKLKSGNTLTLTQSDLWQGGFTMDDATSSTGSFDIGQVITNRLRLSLNDSEEQYSIYDFMDAEVTAWRGGTLQDKTTELLQCGTFTVHEQKKPDSSVELTCLDNMAKTEIPYSNVTTVYPASIQTIVQDICNFCGIILATSTIDNGNYVVSERPNDEALTCRDVLHYAAQISGSFARCDALGRMEFKWYDETAKKHKITAIKSFTPENQDIIITGIQVTDASDEKQSSLYGEKGYILEVSDNPLIEAGKAPAVASHLGKKIIGMSFRPLDLTCILDPSAEAGDPAEVTDRKGKIYTCWITNMTYATGGDMKITCDAETPSDRSAVRFSETTKAIIENRNQIKKERTERETALEELNRQLAESSGMYATAQKQEDGSTIYYMHDKVKLEDSGIIWKLTADALGISTDGGKTYPYGLDVSGTAILNRIYTVGLNADYINTGKIAVKDAAGNILFCADMDTGEVTINFGLLKVGKGYINTDGSFKFGPMESAGDDNMDVIFRRAIKVNYGLEIYGDNDDENKLAFLDFHSGSDVSTNDELYDYTGRFQNLLDGSMVSQFGFTGYRKKTGESGTCNVSVNGTLVHTSDRRLKDNISYLDGEESEDFLMKLKPARYIYIQDPEKKVHKGLIYDEVKSAINPDENLALLATFFQSGTEYGALAYTELIPDLIAALQKQHEEIESLKKKIDSCAGATGEEQEK